MKDIIQRMQATPDEWPTHNTIDNSNRIQWVKDRIDELETEVEDLSAEWVELEEEEKYPLEICCWYEVTRELANQLLDRNECIKGEHGAYYWGRTTTGQSVEDDEVIQDIYASKEG